MAKYRFKLLRGIHNENGKTYFPQEGKNIIETDSDLTRLNSPRSRRVELIPDEYKQLTPGQEDDGLDDMTIAELREFAQGENIDLSTSTKKTEILIIIRGALQLQ